MRFAPQDILQNEMRSDMNINHRLYERYGVVLEYAASRDITPPETFLLNKYNDFVESRQVLDLGIGTGRTTGHLLPIAGNYYGIDYSSAMVEFSRKRFPDANISWGDAKDLSRFEDEVFDSVLFSFNGMDCVDHEGRLRIMSEVRRVLKIGGLFIFSSHNRSFADKTAHGRSHGGYRIVAIMTKIFAKLANPVNFVKKIPKRLRCLLNRMKMKNREIRCEEYAILNDPVHEFYNLHYYIDSAHQELQLSGSGFELVDIVSTTGIPLSKGATAENDVWLYYAARKIG